MSQPNIQDPHLEEIIALVSQTGGIYFAVNTSVPKVDGNRISGPLTKMEVDKLIGKHRTLKEARGQQIGDLVVYQYTNGTYERIQ